MVALIFLNLAFHACLFDSGLVRIFSLSEKIGCIAATNLLAHSEGLEK